MHPTPPIGKLAFEFCRKQLPLSVMQSQAGFYIGTHDDGLPVSRESIEYWPTDAAASSALKHGAWTQKPEP